MNSITSWILLFIKGAAMGAANVIPGVSGGTVAFITGIYERLINCLKSFDMKAIKLALRFKVKEFAQHTDVLFLAVLGLGAVFALLTIAKFLEWAFEHHDLLVWAVFFGLILASIPAVGKMVRKWSIGPVICAVVGCGIAVSMLFLGRAEQNENPVYLGLCGVVAICSMIIPGLSGSFVLLLMGNYELVMIDAINNLTSDPAAAIKILIPVGIGAVVGLIALSRVLSWLFKNYHDAAVSLIAGFILGSLAIIYPWKDAVVNTFQDGDEVKEEIVGFENWRLPDFTSGYDWMAIGLVLVGAFLVFVLERSAPKSDAEPETHA
ncbi:MAG: DUF368 domain-containing protein [Verrucomicrobiota bacterium]